MSDLAAEIEAHVLESQKFSRKHLVLELDCSPQSLRELDEQCDAVEFAIRGGKSPENVAMLTRIWGAYLGEVLRRRWGGTWSVDESGPVLTINHQQFRPHERVKQRLLAGKQHDIEAFYREAEARVSAGGSG
jgi:hypothetical protein